jgi:hypothetical protein
MSTTPAPITITVATTRQGDPEAHVAGCAHLSSKRRGYTHPYDITAASVDDITMAVWGDSLVATDDFAGDHTTQPEAYRAHTIERYSGQVALAPCVKLPAHTAETPAPAKATKARKATAALATKVAAAAAEATAKGTKVQAATLTAPAKAAPAKREAPQAGKAPAKGYVAAKVRHGYVVWQRPADATSGAAFITTCPVHGSHVAADTKAAAVAQGRAAARGTWCAGCKGAA